MPSTLREIWTRRLLLALILAFSAGSAAWQPVRADGVLHTVIPGDNLYRIGLKYGVSWIDIMQANHLPNATIFVGQQLSIPIADSAPTTPPADSAPPAPPQPESEASTYVVRPGDYLSTIAQRFGLTVAQLAAANNIANPSLIFAGQTLTIPGAAGGDTPPTQVPDTPAPTEAPPIASKLILVDISSQQMFVYQDGGLTWNWVVSTGEPGLDTAPGNYSVLNKIPNAYASTWNLWMPDWLGIYWAGRLQNGIHALPILSNGLRLWDGYLGTRVSFGCVILGIAEAQTLYEWAEVGTPVDIQW